MSVASPRDRGRLGSILAVVGIHLLIAWGLVVGLRVDVVRAVSETLNLITVNEAPPPAPKPESPVSPDPEEEGGAAPPDLRAQASPVVAPEPVIVIPRPPIVTAAPTPNDGAANSQGAAEIPGPGTGAGGEGNGTGSGAGGSGAGGGAAATPPRKIAGDIGPRDYPRAASRAGAEGTVGANITIGRDGRISRCVVAQSSGNAELDATTCRLIRERFRYQPARNAAGEAVVSMRGWLQSWALTRR